MKPTARKLLEAMQRGEEISVKTSILRHGISAAGQRMSELRLKHGIDVRDRWAEAPNGGMYKIWFLPKELQTRNQPRTETVVRAHTRRLNVIEDEQPEQISLFG